MARTIQYAHDEIVRDHLLDAKMHLQDAAAELNGISNELRERVIVVIALINKSLNPPKRGDAE